MEEIKRAMIRYMEENENGEPNNFLGHTEDSDKRETNSTTSSPKKNGSYKDNVKVQAIW